MKFKLFFILMAFSMAQSLSARIYYVNALYGSDWNDGLSIQKAWQSLESVSSHAFRAGDSILFHSGMIYEGQLFLRGSGQSGKSIYVGKYEQGIKPELQGNGDSTATLFLENGEYWKVTGLSISNYGAERKSGHCGILIRLKDFGIAHNIVLDSIDIHDVNGSLVKKEGGGAGIICENGGREKISYFDGLDIKNCAVSRTERNGILINGYWSRADWHPSKNVRIVHNRLLSIPGDGIVPIGCDSALIAYNLMEGSPRLLPDGESAAGIWPWSCDNTLIEYNEVSGHKAPWDGQGFDADWNCRNTVIQYNFSHDNEGGFVLICNDGSAGSFNSMGNRETIVRYNVSVNDGIRNKGIHAGFAPLIHVPGPVKNSHIYKNIFYRHLNTGIKTDSVFIAMNFWQGFPDSTFIEKNIFDIAPYEQVSWKESTHNVLKDNLFPLPGPYIRANGLVSEAQWKRIHYWIEMISQPGSPPFYIYIKKIIKDIYR